MGALTLLLIVDVCNREHEVTDQLDKPAIYQPYKESIRILFHQQRLIRTANVMPTENPPG